MNTGLNYLTLERRKGMREKYKRPIYLLSLSTARAQNCCRNLDLSLIISPDIDDLGVRIYF